MAKSITFIINPAARFGKAKKHIKQISKEIKSQASEARIEITRHSLDATNLTKKALNNGCERIVVVGGDGTINEVVNGFFDKYGKSYNEKASLAIMPIGTGSDFFRSIDEPKNLSAQISQAIHGESKGTDVGMVCAHNAHGDQVSRLFINVASLGLSGLALGFMDSVTKRMGPGAAYFLAASKAIKNFTPATIILNYASGEEKIVEKCSIMSFANGKFFGGGMKIAPNAQVDDGLLDVLTVKDLGLMFFLVNGYKVYQGKHLGLDGVSEEQLSELSVRAEGLDTIYIETDGELFAQLPATFSIKPKALLVVRE